MKVELTPEQINHLIGLTQEKDHKDILSTDCYYALQEAKDILYEANFLEEKCNYRLSDNQRRFVIDALTENYEVDFYYSGRGMRGAYCPSVIVKREKTFSSDAKTLQDSLGHDTVIYARD